MMRRVVLVAIAETSMAQADPVSSPTAAPNAYLSIDAEVGYVHGFVALGAFAVGYRLDGSFWVHGLVGIGAARSFNPNGPPDEPTAPGTYFAARGGLEWRGCARDVACAFIGIDAGYHRLHYKDTAGISNDSTDGPILVPRLGVDLGGAQVRFRTELDAVIGSLGFEGIELAGGPTIQW